MLIVLHHLSSLSSGSGIGALGASLFGSRVLDVSLSNLTCVFVFLGSPGATLASVTTAATSVVGVVSTLATSLAASSSTEALATVGSP